MLPLEQSNIKNIVDWGVSRQDALRRLTKSNILPNVSHSLICALDVAQLIFVKNCESEAWFIEAKGGLTRSLFHFENKIINTTELR